MGMGGHSGQVLCGVMEDVGGMWTGVKLLREGTFIQVQQQIPPLRPIDSPLHSTLQLLSPLMQLLTQLFFVSSVGPKGQASSHLQARRAVRQRVQEVGA